MAPPTGSRALTLHTSRAAASINDKISAQAGRIIELNQGEAEWNISDITEATSGLGKDGLPLVDPRGPRNTIQQILRLKWCMRDFDTAWYDIDKNVSVSFSSGFELQYYSDLPLT
jgi:cell division septum initiation protein DivIVA